LSTVSTKKDAKDVIGSVSLTASSILVDSRTRKELEDVLAKVRDNIEAIKRCDVDKDRAELERLWARHSGAIRGLRWYISYRKDAIKNVYNNNIDGAVREASWYDKKIAVATTETVAEFDPFTFDNIQKAAAQGITNYFIYGDTLKTLEEAQGFVRACGYEGDMAAIRFIDKRGLSYRQLVAKIQEDTGFDAQNIGIRAAAGEFELPKKEEGAIPGILLEVQPVSMNDQKVYVAMNSYQTLLKILTQLKEGATLNEINIPGVTNGIVNGAFKYLPRSVPIDYDKEIETYRNAIAIIRSAA
jgi:hypothetical protein